MNIGIIGSGFIGGQLGQLWANAGHSVTFGSRDPEADKLRALLEDAPKARAASYQAAVDGSEVIVVALPYRAIHDTLSGLSGLAGKVVIDATNKMPPTGGSSSQEIAALQPEARVVKAFNTQGGENLSRGQRDGSNPSLLIAGDDQAAKTTVAALAADLGFEAVDAGGLGNAELLEKLAIVWIGLSRTLGRNFAWKILT